MNDSDDMKKGLGVFLVFQAIALAVFLAMIWNPPTFAQKPDDKTTNSSTAPEQKKKEAADAGAPKATEEAAKSVPASTKADVDPKADKDAVAGAGKETKSTKPAGGTDKNPEHPTDGAKPNEQSILVIVLVAGALGGALHALNSFIAYVGNGKFDPSWVAWYLCRAPVGAGVAAIVYFALRGGLMTSSVSNKDINIFGFTAAALLTGMFNRQALDKLLKVAEAFFTASQPERNPLNAKIELTKLEPATTKPAPAAAVDVKLIGKGFAADAIVLVDSVVTQFVRVSDTELKITLAPAALAAAGKKHVQVIRPGKDGAISAVLDFVIAP